MLASRKCPACVAASRHIQKSPVRWTRLCLYGAQGRKVSSAVASRALTAARRSHSAALTLCLMLMCRSIDQTLLGAKFVEPQPAALIRPSAHTKKPRPLDEALFVWCPGTESNRRHGDFQSPALPTELPGHNLRSSEGRVLNLRGRSRSSGHCSTNNAGAPSLDVATSASSASPRWSEASTA